MTRQKNFMKVPIRIWTRLDVLNADVVEVGAVVRVTAADVNAGKWRHLDATVVDGAVAFPEQVLPSPSVGRYSKANHVGRTKVRKDLPKVPKVFTQTSPNWGDWSRGSHTTVQVRQVYPRDFFPPNRTPLHLRAIAPAIGSSEVQIRVGRRLLRSETSFERNLFYDLNLLQENVGAAEVYRSETTIEELLTEIRVNWEILPPGDLQTTIRRVVAQTGATPTEAQVISERMTFLDGLGPQARIAGASGMDHYFGALFADDCVVFENIRYGNAAYVMYEDWQRLSTRSRTELLTGPWEGFDRVVHKLGWQDRITRLIARRLRP